LESEAFAVSRVIPSTPPRR